MSVPNGFISLPSLSQGSDRDLSIESTLGELPLYNFLVKPICLGVDIARIFEKHPLLPGAILVEQGQFAGMISRRRLLEYLIRPHRLELFLHKPLHILYKYAHSEVLILPDSTPILTATQQALRRSPEFLAEPVVVQVGESDYRLLDVQDLNVVSWQIRGIEAQVRYERTQAQMIQSEKMASLGRLVDGVAHEILDPVGFIWGNLTYVSTYTENLIELLSTYETYLPQIPEEIAALKEDIEFDFVQQDLPRSISSIRAGAERLKKLVMSLQNFCHIDDVYPKPADLHACLDSIVLLLKSRVNSEIEIIRNYGHLPPVQCYAGQLNQVFMNILTNAIDALINQAVVQQFTQDFQGTLPPNIQEKPRIEITTEVCSHKASQTGISDSRWVSIRIADNGPGMSPEVQQQILESFSVEKRSAKETSLSVSYQIVTAKHGGKLRMRSRSVCPLGNSLSVCPEDYSRSGCPESGSPQGYATPSNSSGEPKPGIGTEFEILLPLV
ncbi:ATP-binding protein [Coleofasciculus sp. FACHB-SPT9]|uniref:ATP-binding protein n=1 Tax=Cyanophyceae TaxID=3028117 RepID=UPI0016847B53|nr:HAMP domain-containing histidine kinase [Coleofasciculus sp. FACHB-SPT9]